MANPLRGEVTFEALGKQQKLRLDTNALCVLEDDLNIGVAEIAVMMDSGRISVVRSAFRAGLVNGGGGESGTLTLTEAGHIIDEIGFQQALEFISQALKLAFPPAEEEQPDDPPKAARGTGKRSS